MTQFQLFPVQQTLRCKPRASHIAALGIRQLQAIFLISGLVTLAITYYNQDDKTLKAIKDFSNPLVETHLRSNLRSFSQVYIENSTAFNVVIASLPFMLTFIGICYTIFTRKPHSHSHYYQSCCSALFSAYRRQKKM